MSDKKTCEPKQRRIAYAQPAYNHPILKENKAIRRQYFAMLSVYCKEMFYLSTYSKAVLDYYKSIFEIDYFSNIKRKLCTELRVILLLDILHVSGYNRSVITADIIREFRFDKKLSAILEGLFSKLCYENDMWDELEENKYVSSEAEWIECVRKNVAFSRNKPYKIMVTATMSAGKSTFINAIVGEKVANTKTLACTGRLHYIYGKPADDRLISQWDRKLIFDAQKRIINKNEETQKRASYESVYYKGRLSGKQCMILDTPGVNSAEYLKHGEYTDNAVINGGYDALIFLLNYEHIGTDDEIIHLSFVKQNVGENIPVIFCVNKIDSKKRDDMTLEEKMSDIRNYLAEHGFPDAAVFFVSSRAAYLSRAMQTLDNEDDIDELSTLSKKIKRSVNLVKLYDSVKPPYISDSDDSFDYQCGIGYIEDYIVKTMQERND